MHLLCFLNLAKPGIFARAMIFGAQGIFWNGRRRAPVLADATQLFFFSYLISPRICHRFVGYLESQAVVTYTHAIECVASSRLC